MTMKKILITPVVFLLICFHSSGQKKMSYNLAGLLTKNELVTDTSNHAQILSDNNYRGAISSQKIVWLKNISFKNGSIDIDLRGKDVFLQSLIGIAFHASDDKHYEVIYFRPFNFNHADTGRRKWSVQYMVVPDFLYDKLRKEHPLAYENSVTPVPKADEWFHAKIVVKGDSITVFVNNSLTPSLQIKKLNTAIDGKIGLWDDELSGDFANLVITE
jgi:hypothetical protein